MLNLTATGVRPVSVDRRWERRWNLTRPFARVAGKIGFRTRIEGRNLLPCGPYVVAANHLSHVDPPFVGMAIGHPVRFLSASDLQGLNRFLDWVLPFYGTIPLPRSGVPLGAMKNALSYLREGGRVCVFPEGRRTAHWGETTPLTGVAWLALRCQVPIVPLAIAGTDRVMGLDSNFPRLAKVSLTIGESLAPTGNRHELTAAWRSSVEAMLDQ